MTLPSVYANKIDKIINNNTDVYRGDESSKLNKKKDLSELKRKFDSRGYVNKLNVTIETSEGIKDEKLILCLRDCFVNIDNKKIFFDEIINYEIKK